MSDPTPLHALNPTGRFSNRAADYARHRPDYPATAIDAMLDGLGTPGELVAADVGAGTGISARLLAARGVRVFAIEPNAEMRAAAASDPRVTWRAGAAEATSLADASVDLVLCAQAFHWFRASDALVEFGRVLRPGGRVALMWNSRDREDAFTRGYTEAIRAAATEDLAETRPFDPRVIEASGRFGPVRSLAFPHHQSLDREGLRGRIASTSYLPAEGPAHAALVRALDALYAAHADAAGRVVLRYVTRLHLSDLC